MRKNETTDSVDYSAVTPATGTRSDNLPIPDTLANVMPTADTPTGEKTHRADPDKTIPGSEAATGVDQAEQEQTAKNKK